MRIPWNQLRTGALTLQIIGMMVLLFAFCSTASAQTTSTTTGMSASDCPNQCDCNAGNTACNKTKCVNAGCKCNKVGTVWRCD